MRRKVAATELAREIAIQGLDALLAAISDGIIALADDEALVAAAFVVALSTGHKLPDCLYLALAERQGAGLVTADRRLAELARLRSVPVALAPAA